MRGPGTLCAYIALPRPDDRLVRCRLLYPAGFDQQQEDGLMRKGVFAALLAVLTLGAPAWAQEVRGSIEGYVRDTSGGVLPGVTVTLSGGSGVKIDAQTDATGQYRFPSVQPGRYTVTANLAGFAPGKVPDVDVTLGSVKKVD